MKAKQKIRLNMYLAVRSFVNQNEQVTKSIPKLATSFASLQLLIAEIQQIGEMQGINKSGLAIDKKKLQATVISMSVKYSNKVAILAKSTRNDILLKEVRLNESELKTLAAVTLRDRAKVIYDRVQSNFANLEEQGITVETQKQFLDKINAFNDAIASPRRGITERRQATQKLPVLFDAADVELDTMDLAVASAKDEFTDFYNGYKNSRKLVDARSGSLALRASAQESVSGEPLSGAEFTFRNEANGGDGNSNIVKKTSKMGSFHVKSMDAGSYKVSVNKDGYKGKEVSVSVTDGERSELVVELEKA